MDKTLTLAEKILVSRNRLGEDQKTFGKRFGVSRYAVKDWERGATQPRHLEKLREIFAQMLGDEDEESHESVEYQLILPFDEALKLELRVQPQSETAVRLGLVGGRRKTG